MVASYLTLQQLATHYNIAEETVLFFEKCGFLTSFYVGDVRYYPSKACTRIEIVLKGKALGFGLNEIKRLIDAHLPTLRTVSVQKPQLDAQIAILEDEKAALQAAIDRLLAKKTPRA